MIRNLKEADDTLKLGNRGKVKNLTTGLGLPGGAVVRPPCFHCRGTGSIPAQGSSTSLTLWEKKDYILRIDRALENQKKWYSN